MGLGDSAAAVGKGLFAGAAGTAAMTASSALEAKLRDRGAGSAPADAAGEVLGVQPRERGGEQFFANIVHGGYGTSWGGPAGSWRRPASTAPRRTALHFGAIWGSEQVMLPALDVAPPPREMDSRELAIDALHHAIYAVATGAAFRGPREELICCETADAVKNSASAAAAKLPRRGHLTSPSRLSG